MVVKTQNNDDVALALGRALLANIINVRQINDLAQGLDEANASCSSLIERINTLEELLRVNGIAIPADKPAG